MRSDLIGSDWAGSHTVVVVLELIRGAGGGGNTGSIVGLESGLAGDAESSIEACHTVSSAGQTPLAEVIREESISTVIHTVSIEKELASRAGDALDAGYS